MKRLLALLVGSTALAATLSRTATAQEYSNGTGAINQRGRGPAILTPVEAFGVHPPGPDPAYKRCIFFRRWRFTFIPYYAPASPTASSVRWKPWCYFPLMPYYTPYYIGYCPKRLHNPKPAPYGSNGWGQGPMPCEDPNAVGPPPLNFGPYTSVIQDDTIFWRMGGNGLVPYGTPRPPHLGPTDLVDSIQVTRAQGGGFGPGCSGAVAPLGGEAAPAILPPAETVGPKGAQPADNKDTEAAPVEPSEEKAGPMDDKPAEETTPPGR